ncbi:DUF3994 domain-containing protein [Bacillus cereus]|uniref:DUF3994 domain-containing protein n=1 Tax=Bacillus cereus TaxID=1396 RepID=UPI003D17A079
MKIKKIIGIAVPTALLLSGCITVEKPESKEAKTEESSKAKSSETKEKSTNSKEDSKDIKMIMVLPEDYPQLMVDIEEDLIRRLNYYDASVKDSKKGSKSNEEVRDSIKDVEKVFDKLERIDAPGKYKEDHKEIVKAVKKLRESFKEVEQLYDYSKTPKDTDNVIIDKANNKLDEAGRIWKPIFDKLKAEAKGGSTTSTPKSNGSSSSSSSKSPSLASGNEVKSYDSKAKTGIFQGQIDSSDESSKKYKNVQDNLKDGTEVIGNWGIDYGDGVKTTLVLKADKTFETYANGSYPSKDNTVSGTYEAIVNAKQLELKVEKATKDGQEVKLERPIYSTYKIENFDGKSLQIFHIDEHVTILYTKN